MRDILRRNASGRHLNGWHRLWIFVFALWSVATLSVSCRVWPTSESVRKPEVYKELGSEQGKAIFDFYDVLALEAGWSPVTESPTAPRPTTPLAIVNFEPPPKRGPVVDVEGHHITLVTGLSENQMNVVAEKYYSSLRTVLARKRLGVVKWSLLFWLLPPLSLYALGWGVAWVVRGFRRGPDPTSLAQ